MSAIEKWADRVYSETDFGRSVATSLSGILGLVVYLLLGDWVIVALSLIIFFPLARLTATTIHARVSRNANRRAERSDAEYTYSSLTEEERALVSEFVRAGGCVLTWGQVNNSPVSTLAVESLITRQVLSPSVTADGITETFVLDPSLFAVGARHVAKIAGSASEN